jgi:Protein of unknown function (DUF3124)
MRSSPLPSPSNLKLLEGPLPASAVHGQVIYVPIYSSIYSHTSNRMIDLTATLSIHNTDARRDIFIRSANYFDTDGKLLVERARPSRRGHRSLITPRPTDASVPSKTGCA